MAQSFFTQLGMDFDPVAEARKSRQEGVKRSLGFVDRLFDNPGVQGAANTGALLGAGLSSGSGLTPQQEQMAGIQQRANAKVKQWADTNKDASEEDKAIAAQDIAAQEFISSGRSDIGSGMLQQVAETKRTRDLQRKNLELLGYQTSAAKTKSEEDARGDIKTVWLRGEQDPNKSFSVVIDPKTGEAVDSSTGQKLKPGAYTFQAPLDPERGAVYRARIANASGGGVGADLSPEAVDLAAQNYLLNGQLPSGMGKDAWRGKSIIMSRAAQLAREQGQDARAAVLDRFAFKSQVQARTAALKSFNTGQEGRSVRAFNVATQHLSQLHDVAVELQNGNLPRVNQLANALSKEFGGVAPVEFKAIKKIVADELVKSILGAGGGALFDRQEVQETLDAAQTPAQLAGVIANFKHLMAGQLMGLQKQYSASTMNNDFQKYLTPETQSEMGKYGALEGNDPQQSPATWPQSGAQKPPEQNVVVSWDSLK